MIFTKAYKILKRLQGIMLLGKKAVLFWKLEIKTLEKTMLMLLPKQPI